MEMNTIQRLTDARNCIEGKIVATVLALLMALSFLNVSVFADAAYADGNFDVEVGEKAEMPRADRPAASAAGDTGATGAAPSANEKVGDENPGELSGTQDGASSALPPMAGSQFEDGATLTARAEGVTVELAAFGSLPEGTRLLVEIAETDEAKTAALGSLGENEALFHIYQIALVDEEGAELNLAGARYRLTMTWDGMIASALNVYRVNSIEAAVPVTVERPLTSQGEISPNSLTFMTDHLNAPFAFAMPGKSGSESESPADPADSAGDVPSPEGRDEVSGETAGKDANDPDAASSDATGADEPIETSPRQEVPAGSETTSIDDTANAHQITLYVGETRDLSRFVALGGTWSSENSTVATVTVGGKVTALVAGDTVVRCGEELFNVTVRPAPAVSDEEGPQLAYFYFLPPSEDGLAEDSVSSAATGDVSGAKFLGSGLVRMPYGYESGMTLVNGSVLAESKDADGNIVRDKVVNLDELIVSAPSEQEVALGLRAYYNGSLDEGRSKISYNDITGYSYDAVRIDGKGVCTDYNGQPLQPSSALRVYVQMRIETSDMFTATYKVAAPTGLLTHAVLHKADDPAIELRGYDPEGEGAKLIVVDGATYAGVQHMSESGTDYYFDGWYLDGSYRQRAGAQYGEKASATFYARYLSQEALTATFNADGGAFADGAAVKEARVDAGGTYWLPEAPARFGYEFLGWVNDSTGGHFAADTGLVMGDADASYTASWKASPSSITLDAVQGAFGTGEGTIVLKGVTGGPVDHAAAAMPVRIGYKLVGWNTAADGSGTKLATLPDTFAGGAMTLYAQYEEDPSQYYTVTYRTSSMAVLSQPGSLASESNQLYDRNLIGSDAVGLRGATAASRFPDYYVFSGWYKLNDDGTRDLASSEAALTPEAVAAKLNRVGGNCADTTFEAVFTYSHSSSSDTAPFLVEYYLMGDDGSYSEAPVCTCIDSVSGVLEGQNCAIPERYIGKVNSSSSPNFSFLEPGHGNNGLGIDPIEGFKADRYVMDESLTTMTALCQPGEMLTFKVYLAKRLGIRFEAGAHGELSLEGAEDAAIAGADAIEYHLLRGAVFPQVPVVKPDAGYVFAGWKIGAEDTTESFAHPVERALTATACYEAQEATIAFETNGGSSVEPLVGVTDAAVPGALSTPVRVGYTLQGWYDNRELAGEPLATLPEVFPAGTTTYYAKWTADGARIVFDRNADDATGSQPGIQGVTDGEIAATFPEKAGYAREGYEFAGWNTKADGTGETVTTFPESFAPGVVTYYAQWKLDVRGLSAEVFSSKGTYTGRGRGIALPAALKMKDGETLTLLDADDRSVADPYGFACEVADSAEDLTVIICDAAGTELARIGGVSVVIEPATLTVTTSSVIYPFDGNAATSEGIAVTGLQNGETIGYRAIGQAFQVGDVVDNGFELTWADGTNGYTAKEGNYNVVADLGTIRVVSSACPVKVEGYVGVYDGLEHAVTYEIASEEAQKATISFDGPTAYTDAGNRAITYTVECADHGVITGSIDLKILPRPVSIAVEDSFKVVSTADPAFTGSIVAGDLVNPNDLGAVSFVRTNDAEEIGFYPEVLSASYLRNRNYDVKVIPGTFTIGPAGASVVPPSNPLLPPDSYSSLGAGMPEGADTPATAVAGVVTTMVALERAQAVAEQFGDVAGIILDEGVPMASPVSFSDEEPTVTRVGGEEFIADDATALGAFDEPRCWVHWIMLVGILLTIGYASVVVARRLGYAREISDFDNYLTGTAEAKTPQATRVARRA